jgi:hypothetical protein
MRTRTRTILAGLVSAAALVGGVAWATSPGPSGLIQGCYKTSNGSFRVVERSDDCKSSETAISWNRKGEPGAAGANGHDGAPGANGALGTPGATGLDGKDGAAGARGADGAKGDPCLPSDPACRGPKGDTGETGATGAQGPAGTSAGSTVSLAALNGTPCGTGGTAGVTAVKYTAGADADAISITCSHHPKALLDVYGVWTRQNYTCGGGFTTPYPCDVWSAGTVTVSPPDASGTTSCSTANAQTFYSRICALRYEPGTTVTLTAAQTAGSSFGWGLPANPEHPAACADTVGPVCTITLGGDRSVLVSFSI